MKGYRTPPPFGQALLGLGCPAANNVVRQLSQSDELPPPVTAFIRESHALVVDFIQPQPPPPQLQERSEHADCVPAGEQVSPCLPLPASTGVRSQAPRRPLLRVKLKATELVLLDAKPVSELADATPPISQSAAAPRPENQESTIVATSTKGLLNSNVLSKRSEGLSHLQGKFRTTGLQYGGSEVRLLLQCCSPQPKSSSFDIFLSALSHAPVAALCCATSPHGAPPLAQSRRLAQHLLQAEALPATPLRLRVLLEALKAAEQELHVEGVASAKNAATPPHRSKEISYASSLCSQAVELARPPEQLGLLAPLSQTELQGPRGDHVRVLGEEALPVSSSFGMHLQGGKTSSLGMLVERRLTLAMIVGIRELHEKLREDPPQLIPGRKKQGGVLQPRGRLLAGTMESQPPPRSLQRSSGGRLSASLEGCRITASLPKASHCSTDASRVAVSVRCKEPSGECPRAAVEAIPSGKGGPHLAFLPGDLGIFVSPLQRGVCTQSQQRSALALLDKEVLKINHRRVCSAPPLRPLTKEIEALGHSPCCVTLDEVSKRLAPEAQSLESRHRSSHSK
eukprot:scaffold895_cov315-Pinguiococcus_pyrenoidosus.AAC.35